MRCTGVANAQTITYASQPNGLRSAIRKKLFVISAIFSLPHPSALSPPSRPPVEGILLRLGVIVAGSIGLKEAREPRDGKGILGNYPVATTSLSK